jgi:hypothetical protein
MTQMFEWFKKKPKVELEIVPLEPVNIDVEHPSFYKVAVRADDGTEVLIDKIDLEPSVTIKHDGDRSRSMPSGQNFYQLVHDFNNFNVLNSLKCKKVYIYNVSAESFKVKNSHFEATIPACPKDKEFVLFTSIPEVIGIPKLNVDTCAVDLLLEDGKRIAMDLINPDNLGLDQTKECRFTNSDGSNNIGKKGVFWSLHSPPLKSEVKAAKKRMEGFYKFLLEKAKVVELSNPKELKNILTPEHYLAAEHFDSDVFWRAKRLRELKALAEEINKIKML